MTTDDLHEIDEPIPHQSNNNKCYTIDTDVSNDFKFVVETDESNDSTNVDYKEVVPVAIVLDRLNKTTLPIEGKIKAMPLNHKKNKIA